MNYLEQIQKLVQEKIEKQSPQERLEKLQLELKKENPDFSLIESLLEKGVGKKMTMEKVQMDFLKKQEKKNKKEELSNNLRILNEELKKENPDFSLIESLLEKGVGKKMNFEEIKEKRAKMTIKKYKSFVSKLQPDLRGVVKKEELEILKTFLKMTDIELNPDIPTKVKQRLIHIAVGMGDIELAQMLIDRGADLESEARYTVYKGWKAPLDWSSRFNVDGLATVKKMIEEELNKK